MRLLILSSEFPPGPGGIGTHAHEIARHLHRRDWEVAVVAPQPYAIGSEITEFNRAQPFRVIPLLERGPAPVKWPRRLLRVRRLAREWVPDVVMASGMRAVWLAAPLCKLLGLPWMAVGHGTEFGFQGPIGRRLNRICYGAADAVVCVSDYTRSQMMSAGIRPGSVRVVHNGADGEFFGTQPPEVVAATRKRLGLEASRVILTVGQVSERKGQDIVIRALARMRERVPDAHYLIAGLPTEAAAYEALARELRVEGRVHFLGRVERQRLLDLLNACDLFVMTSRHTAEGDFEGYGIAVVEAALCGRPAVVSADSGLVEAIQPGRTGAAVPQEDPEAVAEALTALLLNDEERRRMGEAARERAVREQTWASRAAEYEQILDRMLGRETPP